MKEDYKKEENELTRGGINYKRVHESVLLSGTYNHEQVRGYEDRGFRISGTCVNMSNNYKEVSIWKETLTEIKEPVFVGREHDEDDCSCHIVAPCGCCEQKSINYKDD